MTYINVGGNLVANGDFSLGHPPPPPNGFISLAGLESWTKVSAGPLEIVANHFGGNPGLNFPNGALDTQSSPGGVDIFQNVSNAFLFSNRDISNPGATVKIDFDLAAQSLTGASNHLQILANGVVVGDFTKASLGDVNVVHHESVNVTVPFNDIFFGPHTFKLEIRDTGPASNVGFLIGNVEAHNALVQDGYSTGVPTVGFTPPVHDYGFHV